MNSELRNIDAVVVGGGPSGLAAALWLARYRRSVAVFDSGEYRAASVERSHGYLGRDPQHPMDLLERGRQELLAYPTACIERQRVAEVAKVDGGFAVGPYLAQRLVLACGVQDVFPEVAGFAEHYGASVFHCPSCDGYEARDQHVVVLGWSEHLVGFVGTLLNWARSVTIVTNAHRFEGDEQARTRLAQEGVRVLEENAVTFVGSRGDLRSVLLGSGQELPASHVFFSVAHVPRTELPRSLGCEIDDDGYVTVNACGETSVPGVYSAGDLTPGLQLVAVAAATGVVAGVAAAQSFLS